MLLLLYIYTDYFSFHINNYIYGSYKHIIYTYSFTLPFFPFFQLAWVRSDRRRKALEEGRRLARAEAFGTAGPCFFPWENDAMLGIMCVCVYMYTYIYVYIYTHIYHDKGITIYTSIDMGTRIYPDYI